MALNQMFPRKVYACKADVSSYEGMQYLLDYAVEKLDSLDFWVNNAGIDQNRKTVWTHNPQKMHQVIDINIKGVLNGTAVAISHMQKNGGAIYNLEGYGSDDAMTPTMSIYGMTKRAVTYYTKSVAKELVDLPVLIGTLSPGIVMTELMMASLPKEEKIRSRFIRVYNILGDTVDDVSTYLVKKMIDNQKNGVSIKWLTKRKAMFRFMTQPIVKRKLRGLE